ncbi:MAG: hypothetical protein KF824_01455 [Fimbriimonadaceae bacterium]|nr:MAG: hypothetical protein KF824_01455 [Fimbriimonadaceae bacterium]
MNEVGQPVYLDFRQDGTFEINFDIQSYSSTTSMSYSFTGRYQVYDEKLSMSLNTTKSKEDVDKFFNDLSLNILEMAVPRVAYAADRADFELPDSNSLVLTGQDGQPLTLTRVK